MTTIVPDFASWEAWTPEQVAALLDGVRVPWYVAAGWALDLFAGEQRRHHDDLELGVPNTRFDEVAEALGDFEIFLITAPEEATPLAEARGRFFDTHQTWVRDRAAGRWRFDFFREPSDGDTWICRREPAIRVPYEQLIEWTDDGIPYGRPEVVLLMKAKHSQLEKNKRDFATTVPLLDAERRRWLRDGVELMHPGHEWLEAL